MSMNDRLAARAVLQGQTSQHFKATAQEHARVVWLCLIGGALLWYFGGWKWAAVPLALAAYAATQQINSLLLERKIRPYDSAITLALKKGESELREAEALVNRYGDALGKAAGSLVADTSLLPADKDSIKAAILRCLKVTRDAQQRELLKVAYVSLSSFQEGAGPTYDSELARASVHEGTTLLKDLGDLGF